MYQAQCHGIHSLGADPYLPRVLRSDPTGSGRTEEINEKANPADSYRLSTPERVLGIRESRRGDKDGRSRTGVSERSEEPQRDTREK